MQNYLEKIIDLNYMLSDLRHENNFATVVVAGIEIYDLE
jgi:hypothetical protein